MLKEKCSKKMEKEEEAEEADGEEIEIEVIEVEEKERIGEITGDQELPSQRMAMKKMKDSKLLVIKTKEEEEVEEEEMEKESSTEETIEVVKIEVVMEAAEEVEDIDEEIGDKGEAPNLISRIKMTPQRRKHLPPNRLLM